MRTLQARFMVILITFVLVTLFVVGTVFYSNSNKLVADMVGTQALAIAEQAQKVVDAETFSIIVEKGDQDPAYTKMREQLNALRVANGLKYLYTMRITEANGDPVYEYVVDGMPEGSEDASGFAEAEEEPDESIKSLFATGEPQAGNLDRTEDYGATLTAYVPVKDGGGKVIGAIGADFDASRIYALQKHNLTNMLLIAGAIIVVGAAAAILVSRMLTRPLRRLNEQVRSASEGDLTIAIEVGRRKDEIGQLSSSVGLLIGNLKSFIRMLSDHAAQLNRLVEFLQDSTDSSREQSRLWGEVVHHAAEGAQAHLLRSKEMTVALEESAAGVGRIADSALEALEAATSAHSSAENGSEQITKVVNRMNAIQETNEQLREAVESLENGSADIDKFVVGIASIAARTKVLALNAGIEAARAAEHGKGFAVVAVEVRKLAEQTADLSEQVSTIIHGMQLETRHAAAAMEGSLTRAEEGREAAEAANESFTGILTESNKLQAAMETMSVTSQMMAASTEETAASVQDAEIYVSRTADNLMEVSEASEEQHHRMDLLGKETQSLREASNQLQSAIQRFRV